MGISLRLEKLTKGSTEQKVFAVRAIQAVRAVYTNDEANNNAVAYPLNPHSNSQKNEKINPREKLGNEYSSSSFGEVKIWNVESSLNSKTAEENRNHKDPFPITRTLSLR